MFRKMMFYPTTTIVGTIILSCSPTDQDLSRISLVVPDWAEVVQLFPDSSVVSEKRSRDALLATGLAWKVRDRRSGIELLVVPPGNYRRGDLADEPEPRENVPEHQSEYALPVHHVSIDKPFYLGRFEVTIGQWSAFTDETGYLTAAEDSTGEGGSTITTESDWRRDKAATWRDPSPGIRPAFSHVVGPAHPVAQVAWEDAKAFADHYGFRLPTEAEWEYAARAGTETKYWWGNQSEDGGDKFNVSDRTSEEYFNWPSFPLEDGFVLTAPTDRDVKANPWGFVDMLGNLQEWMSNLYDAEFYTLAQENEPIDGRFDDRAVGTVRAYRGGCWDSSPGQANVFVRGGYYRQTDVIGFRVVKDP